MSVQARAANAVQLFRTFEVLLVLAHLRYYLAFFKIAHLRYYLIVIIGCLLDFPMVYNTFLLWHIFLDFPLF